MILVKLKTILNLDKNLIYIKNIYKILKIKNSSITCITFITPQYMTNLSRCLTQIKKIKYIQIFCF